MKPEETVDFHVRWLWAKIAKRYNSEATKIGGSMSIGYVLLNIDQEKGSPSTSLGPAMGMEATSLSRLLKRMEELKLITKKKDKKDGRLVRIFLTELGKDMRAKSRESVINFNNEVSNIVPPEKLEVFFDVMGTINKMLTND